MKKRPVLKKFSIVKDDGDSESHSKVGESNPPLILIVAAVLVVIGLAAALYFFIQYKKSQDLLTNPNLAAQQQVQDLVTKVGRLIELPSGEQPTVATVSDVTKLKDQPFFANAVNGDKVLIYTKARKAILYDPTANKIVEVGPVNLGNSASSQTSPSSSATSPTPTQGSVNI